VVSAEAVAGSRRVVAVVRAPLGGSSPGAADPAGAAAAPSALVAVREAVAEQAVGLEAVAVAGEAGDERAAD
jgi:hypothetical protein